MHPSPPPDTTFRFDSPEFYLYAACGAAAVIVLAVVLYFLPAGKLKLPAIALSSLSSLIAGLALGMLVMSLFGYHWYPQPAPKLPPGTSAPMQMGQSPGPPRGGPGGIDLLAKPSGKEEQKQPEPPPAKEPEANKGEEKP
jgi:hypothetical protein